jgi:GPH family glycoside/pentoside/hexuronide:cation symporter
LTTPPPLSRRTKFIYGVGDWGSSAASTARNIFWFVFLTNVVGIGAGLAGGVVLIGRIWDSINDPLIGTLSDRLNSRLGRRRPFLLYGAIPFAMAFVLMFYVPPWESRIALAVYYSVVFLLFDTLYTIVNVPYLALMPELTEAYDERSSLTGWRIAFSILASLVTAGLFKLLAENVFAAALGGGPDALRQGYLIAAGLWSVTIALPFLLVAYAIEEPATHQPVDSPIRPVQTFVQVFSDQAFRIAALIYLISFTTGDIILAVLVRYLIDYVRMPLGFDNLVVAMVLASALVCLPIVVWLMRRTDKRTAYLISIGFLVGVLVIGSVVPPGNPTPILIGAVLAGFGFAALSTIPWAIVADVVEADELKHGERREGLFAGYLVFLRKMASAFAIFAVGQLLAATGFISSTSGSVYIEQPAAALSAMRFLVTVVPAVALTLALILAWRFPISREAYEAIQAQLAQRRLAATADVDGT